MPLDHTSVLKTIETRWNLPALTARDAAAGSVGGVLTLATPRTDDPLSGVVVPIATGPHPDEERPSHLQQIQAELVAQLPVPDEEGGAHHVMPQQCGQAANTRPTSSRVPTPGKQPGNVRRLRHPRRRIVFMDRRSDPTIAETVDVERSVSHISSSFAAEEGRFVSGTLLGGRYRIIGLLGRGGMGEVYRATDLALGQSVALKFLPEEAAQNQRLLERFHGEVRVARQVSHPNVCRVYDIGETDGMPFISMEYVDGEDLSSLLLRIGRLPADKAIETARKICAGLAAAHDRGIIHRDLKPQNIMMNKRGDVVIMDFGLAAIADQLSGSEVRNGTPAYMAPEQLKGSEVTGKSDIYALGLVLYELFTGRRPYTANSAKELLRQEESAQLTSMTSIAADIDPAVEKAIRRCLEPDPAKRPANALSVAAALPGGDPLAAALRPAKHRRRNWWLRPASRKGWQRKCSNPCPGGSSWFVFSPPLGCGRDTPRLCRPHSTIHRTFWRTWRGKPPRRSDIRRSPQTSRSPSRITTACSIISNSFSRCAAGTIGWQRKRPSSPGIMRACLRSRPSHTAM